MSKNLLLLCNGLSGSGKTTFIQNYLGNNVYNLKSLTTRNMREDEIWGEKYYFVDEDVFNAEPTATQLFVNEAFWKPGDAKWLYGVPEFEINNHLGQNLVYDVIQPRYSRQLIDWFIANRLDKYYDYRVLWFLPPSNSTDIVKKRANMTHDADVRRNNTCDAIDFLRVLLTPNYLLKSSAEETIIPLEVHQLVNQIAHTNGTVPQNLAAPQTTKLELLADWARTKKLCNPDYRKLAHKQYFGR